MHLAAISLLILFAVVFAENCHSSYPYIGNEFSCFCSCQHSLPKGATGRCNYLGGDPAGCTFCVDERGEINDDFQAPIAIKAPTSSPVIGSGYVGKTGQAPAFALKQTVCLGGHDMEFDCNPYTGSDAECMNWCKTIAAEYIYGEYTCGFLPWGEFSSGGCTVTGQVDPCRPMPGL
ncbi:hypothetical protein J8273_4306 [Carpediemonas membranifera]|uniref:Secreted protein n=1 Tax=Carpediemonas membranifera TaxID=201153 RepID=A0A8J6B4L1_9EUKA|nr:hypothetical protein J8273_4306 [Carpediemonas membranifera]|eukprot:KAG9394204.1 hypothetical protein J8273_4306 [Carpediemonas membranifera]